MNSELFIELDLRCSRAVVTHPSIFGHTPNLRHGGADLHAADPGGPLVWHDPGVDPAYYEEIAGRLHGLLIRLDDRLTGKDMTLIAEFIDANELGLALEQMADVLSEDEQVIDAEERADMLALAERMQLGVRVPGALRFCPER